ncbi:MAG: hypothetical protein ACR2NF_04705 [Pirellulales bacterium]
MVPDRQAHVAFGFRVVSLTESLGRVHWWAHAASVHWVFGLRQDQIPRSLQEMVAALEAVPPRVFAKWCQPARPDNSVAVVVPQCLSLTQVSLHVSSL